MPPRDRNSLKRSESSQSTYNRAEFRRDFPDDATCLEWLKDRLYPDGILCKKCQEVTKHHRVASRPSYSCDHCGHHVHPTAGTIFHKSSTSLVMWFEAIFLMSQTRCGISAKQLERELGVTYKTAWRMFNAIRKLMAEDGGMFAGQVEADETYIGGMAKWKKNAQRKAGIKQGRPGADSGKVPVFGIVQRGQDGQHGRIRAKVVPNTSAAVLLDGIEAKVLDKAIVYTDEYHPYDRLGKRGYTHRRVHHAASVYVDGDAHTNTIEGFWFLLKSALRGVYHGVSTKHLQSYIDEYTYRYNHRRESIFHLILGRIQAQPVE